MLCARTNLICPFIGKDFGCGCYSYMNYISSSEQETFELGKELADKSKVFLLYGDLGAGKTTLIRGICVAFGVPREQVHSPTFAIVNEYESSAGIIYHFDAYRLTADEWVSGGFDEYLDNGICLIEWAENMPEIENSLKIIVDGSGNEPRCITLVNNE